MKQIYLLPDVQRNGYAQTAIKLAEALYPAAKRWGIDTVQQKESFAIYMKNGVPKGWKGAASKRMYGYFVFRIRKSYKRGPIRD